MKIKGFEFNMFGEMTYVVYNEKSLDAAIIDPGMLSTHENQMLARFLSDNRLTVRDIIATHLHVDHVMGLSWAMENFGTGISANPADAFLGSRIAEQVQMFHLPLSVPSFKITRELKAGDTINLGDEKLIVIEVPGHSPGSIALYSPEGKFVVTGDALFRGSIGRTDLPGGDYATLITSIRNNLLSLPDETIVYPGHGPLSTIGNEKKSNPFI